MKFTAITLAALASVVAALPEGGSSESSNHWACKPGTYACAPNGYQWLVCNTSGQFVNGGTCPPKTICKFNIPNGSPYCVPPGFQI